MTADDPNAYDDNKTTWMTCPYCYGQKTIRDRNDLDITCPICDGDGGWEP